MTISFVSQGVAGKESVMFTGLIEEIGTLKSVSPMGSDIRLAITCEEILGGISPGSSISVDGCCLTVETVDSSGFTAYASPETMKKTSLGERQPGNGLNLERAMTLGGRLGGHLVAGHVDATGEFLSARQVDNAWELRVRAPREIIEQTIPKGSIAIDGISLTVVDLMDEEISSWIIPETWNRTSLAQKRPGQRVNLESDMIGKYVFRFLQVREEDPRERDDRLRSLLEQGGWGSR